jgi:hypothetical protein
MAEPTSDLFDFRSQDVGGLRYFNWIHLIVLIFLGFEIPIFIGFSVEINPALIVFEILTIVESVLFVCVNYRSIRRNSPTSSFKEAIRIYHQRGLILDLLACSPLTILMALVPGPIWLTVPLRLLRLFGCYSIIWLFEKLEVVYLEMTRYVTVVKTLLFLLYLWHWSSCTWFFVNDSVESDSKFRWIDLHDLSNETLLIQYLYSIYFTMNIVTSVGYGDMYGTTDTERVVTCLIILTGDALFAVAFGMMVNLAAK